jgi:hypothetical protein
MRQITIEDQLAIFGGAKPTNKETGFEEGLSSQVNPGPDTMQTMLDAGRNASFENSFLGKAVDGLSQLASDTGTAISGAYESGIAALGSMWQRYIDKQADEALAKSTK